MPRRHYFDTSLSAVAISAIDYAIGQRHFATHLAAISAISFADFRVATIDDYC
jgi:putative NADH-flavin reductase